MRPRGFSGVFIVVAVMASSPMSASGQPVANAPTSALQVSIGAGGEPKGEVDCPRLCEPFGGGGFVTGATLVIGSRRRVQLVIDALRGPGLDAIQRSRRLPSGFNEFTTEHRDAVIAAGPSWLYREAGSAVEVRGAVLAGFGFRRTSRTPVPDPGAPGVAIPPTVLEAVVPAVGAGVDIMVPVAHTLAIVPGARVYGLIERRDVRSPDRWRGVSSILASATVGLAVRF